MKEEENKRKSIILMAIGVLTLLIVVGGATYAYFQAQIDKGASSNVDITTNITDSLTFQTNDLEVKLDKVDDNDTKNELVIKATQDNFGEGNNSIGDGVNAIAHLIAGGEDYQAEYNYYLYLNITKNELQYSSYKNGSETKFFKTEEEKNSVELTEYTPIPELYLTIKKNGEEITKGVTIGGEELSYTKDIFTETGKEPESKVGGFDITEIEGAIKIADSETISVTKETKNHTTEDNWEIIVTLVNLATDQQLNTGKSISGKVLIQSEEKLLTLGTVCKNQEFGNCIAENYQLDSFLIKHDGNQDNESEENYTLEARDDSIRYTGGNIKISEELKNQIVNDLYDSYKFIAGTLYWNKDDKNRSDIKKFLEVYEEVSEKELYDIEPTEEEAQFIEEFGQKVNDGEINIYESKEEAIQAVIKEKEEAIKEKELEKVFDSFKFHEYTFYLYKDDENASYIKRYFEIVEKAELEGEEKLTPEELQFVEELMQKVESGEVEIKYFPKEEALADAIEKGKLQEVHVDVDDINFEEEIDSYDLGLTYYYWLKTSENAEIISKGMELSFKINSGEKQEDNLTPEEQQLYEQFQSVFEELVLEKEIIMLSKTAAAQNAVERGLISGYEGIEYLNNYVCLDDKTAGSCTSDEDLYRIIGIFKNDKGNYEMKLIKASIGTTKELGDEKAKISEEDPTPSAYASGTRYNWNNSDSAHVAYNDNTNVNMWRESNLNKVNLNTFYYNYITSRATYLKGHVTEHIWTTGGFSGSSNKNAKETYELELGANKVKVDDEVCYTPDDAKTPRKCTKNDIEYQDEIGLMYFSDYMYAAYSTAWATNADVYDNYEIKANNWMSLEIGINEWTISRNSSNGYSAKAVDDTGYVYSNDNLYDNLGARPVFYLDSSVKLKDGEGSVTAPYRLLED